jgi:hypothetical protein
MDNQHNKYGKDDLKDEPAVLRTVGLANGKTLEHPVRIQIFDELCQEDRQILTFDYHFLVILKRIHSGWQEEWKTVDI